MYKVSILVPIYGVEHYIECCARSLFEQTYPNLEFVFVDDCTPDRSVEILKKVMEDYPEKKDLFKIIYHTRNRGLAAARNTAVAAAKGNFLMHVDSDDWIEPNMVELLVNEQQKTNADIVSCNFLIHYPYGNEVFEEPNYRSKDEMMRSVLQMTLDHTLCRRLIRSSLYMENHIEAVEGVNIGEDHYTLPRLLFYANSFTKCDKALYHYNWINQDSYMRMSSPSFGYVRYRNNRDSINILLDFFVEHDKDYLDELYSIKARYVYNQFFPVLKEGNAEAYNELTKDWKSIEDAYKLSMGLNRRRIMLLNGKYALNRTRVFSRIVLKKLFGIRNYEL